MIRSSAAVAALTTVLTVPALLAQDRIPPVAAEQPEIGTSRIVTYKGKMVPIVTANDDGKPLTYVMIPGNTIKVRVTTNRDIYVSIAQPPTVFTVSKSGELTVQGLPVSKASEPDAVPPETAPTPTTPQISGNLYPLVQVRPDPPLDPQFQPVRSADRQLAACGRSADQALQCGLTMVSLLLQKKAGNLPVLSANFAPGALQDQWDNRVGSLGKFRRLWNAMGRMGSYPGGGGYAATIRIESERAFTDITFVFDMSDQLANVTFEAPHEASPSGDSPSPEATRDAQQAADLMAALVRGDTPAFRQRAASGNAAFEDGIISAFSRSVANRGTPVRYFVSCVTQVQQYRRAAVVVIMEHAWFQMWFVLKDGKLSLFSQPEPGGAFRPPTLAPIAVDGSFARN
jgi:hypothetical protein